MAAFSSIVLAAAVAVSAASAAYSAYSANEAAEEQEEQLKKQQEQARQAGEVQKQNQLAAAKATRAQQRAQLAASGVSLSDETDSTVMQLGTDLDTSLNRNLNLIDTQTGWTVGNLQSQINMLPSAGAIATGAALKFGASAANTYANCKAADKNSNLLERSYTQNASTRTFDTAQGTAIGSLLNGTATLASQNAGGSSYNTGANINLNYLNLR